MTRENLPNEPGAWDRDFSFGYLATVYARLAHDFTPSVLGDARALVEPEEQAADATRPTTEARRRVYVRHDIDVSLDRAVPIARLERELGIVSSYHVMLASPFYDLRSERSRAALAEIRSLGHEVGLHYDVLSRGTKDATSERRERDIDDACRELETVLREPVRSLSFHMPVPELIRGPLEVAGRVSGYGKALFQWYISDSRARFREGDPLESLARPRAATLQLLIHPIWWGTQHVHPGARLRAFLSEVVAERGGSVSEWNDRLWEHIIYRADEAL